MYLRTFWLGCSLAIVPLGVHAEVSVANGERVSIIGGCHDCHTAGYNEAQGKIDPAAALKGTSLGYAGPWGVTYPMNLRITAERTEDAFVQYLHTFQARPPMPWFNVHALNEDEVRSLYAYIKSLGAPGEQVPDAVAPGEAPQTPYITMAPPTMPAK